MHLFDQMAEFHGGRLANQLVNISLKDKYVWFKNPKVASSTLDLTLQMNELRETPYVQHRPHAPLEMSVYIKPYQLPDEQLEILLSVEEYLQFTFVRNPYERLVSAYLDKIMNETPQKKNLLELLGRNPEPLDQKFTWEEFVDAVCTHAPNEQDQHWMPQIYTTNAKWITHQFIGKMETFDSDFRKLAQLLNIDIDRHYKYHAPHKTTASTSWKDFYKDENLRKKVHSYFEADFDTFGYSKSID